MRLQSLRTFDCIKSREPGTTSCTQYYVKGHSAIDSAFNKVTINITAIKTFK